MFCRELAGIRLTVARLFSPTSQPVTGQGIIPTHPVAEKEDPIAEAKKQLLRFLNGSMMMPPMPSPPMDGGSS